MHDYSQPLLIAAVGTVVVLSIGAILPGNILDLIAPYRGSLLHGVGVGLVNYLAVLALPRWWLASTGLIIVAIGAAELLQPIFGRSAQWSDLWAGVAGLLLGAVGAGATLIAIRAIQDRSHRNRRS